MGNEDLDLGEQGNKAIYFREQGNGHLRKDLMHALIISPFIRKELQLTFNANEVLCTADFAETVNI